jgi:hypothetical protein
VGGAWLLGISSAPAYSQVNVTTYHNDNARTGQNRQETTLTPANVNSTNFGRLFSFAVDSWIVAQPLYISNLIIAGCSGTHNVVFVATLDNSVYALDADNLACSGTSSTMLWHWKDPVGGATKLPCPDSGFNQVGGAGIVGTPAINSASKTLYLVDKTASGLSLWALDIASGLARNHVAVSPTSLPAGVTFLPQYQMGRPGLLLGKSAVYVALGSTGCKLNDGITNHGYVVAYNTGTLAQAGVFVTTPEVNNGGIWQSGGGLAQDSLSDIYFETADASFDASAGGLDYGDSILKLNPSTGLAQAADYFTPYNQATMLSLDLEPGSVGPVVIDNNQGGQHPHLLIGSGKTEEIYVMDRNQLGGYCSGCTSNTNIVQDVPAAGTLSGCVQTSKLTCGYGAPVYWNNNSSNTASGYLYFPENGSNVLAYQVTNGVLSSQPVAMPTNTSANVGSASISANGATDGIIWEAAATNTQSGALFAFNATPLGSALQFLYNSNQAGSRDTLGGIPHFVTPTIANGKVYVGTGAISTVPNSVNALVVYGLLH